MTLVGLNCYADVDTETLTTARTGGNVKGSTMAVDLSEENISVEYTMTVKLVEDVDVTNGRIEVTFDPEVLTYVGASSLNAYYAINASEADSGKIVVAYASADTITAGEVIAALRFSFDGELDTSLTVTVTERNGEKDLNESDTIFLGEEEDQGLPFTDVTEDQWFYEYVAYVYENGLMNGMSETIFNPDGTVDRAMVVTVLYRMAGCPEVDELSSFVDVSTDFYYAEAVAWAEAEAK